LYPIGYKYKPKGKQMTLIGRGPSVIAEAVALNGEKIVGEFILDTGSNSSLTLTSTSTDTTKIKDMVGTYKKYTSYDMCGNSHFEYEGKGKNINLSSLHAGQYPLTISVTNDGVLADKTYKGIIGLPVLRCFNILFDFSENKVFLEPNEFLANYSQTAKH
jgi:hypothetical protein